MLGAIYRVCRKGAKHVEDPRGLSINWTSLSSSKLVKLLADPRMVVRKRAISQLAKTGVSALDALATALQESSSREARRNALWTLTQIDSPLARKMVRSALMDKDGTVRHAATQSISLWRDQDAITVLQSLLQDADLQVRRNAAEALGRIGNPAAVSSLLNAAAQLDSNTAQLNSSARVLEHSFIFALIEIADRAATLPGLGSENPRVHRAALMALDQMHDGQLPANAVTPLLASTNPVLKDTANWIVGRHPDWGSALAGFFQERFKSSELNASEAADLQVQLAPFTRNAAIQALLTSTVADSTISKPLRLVVLRAMAQANPSPVPSGWLQAVADALHSQDTGLMRDGIATARAFAHSKGGNPELEQALKQIGDNSEVTPELRLAALTAASPLETISSNLFKFLLGSVDATKPWSIRNNAASVLSKAKLDHAQLLLLSDALHTVGPAELLKLLNPFENSNDEAIGLSLINNLKAAKAVSSLRLEVLKPKISKFPDAVQKKAQELLSILNTDAAKQKEHLDQLLVQMPKGDVRRGQAIFNNPKVACSGCHAMGYLGGHVGPDLTSVGTIRSERDLLESIIYPSASFVRSFEPMIVLTRGGEDYTGVLRRDSADEVVLVTGPETEVHISRLDIVEMHQGTVSIMPQGLDSQLSMQELADLVAFLKNTKWGAR